MGIIILVVVLAVLALMAIGIYNSLVSKRNNVKNAFATIDVMLKKRFDLIPNLVETVKQFTQHETEIFDKVAASHGAAYSSLSNSQKAEIDANMQQAQRSFFAIAEQFPELKSSENYRQLQGALNETEEQLSAARRGYNAAVTEYNTSIQSFPKNIFAGVMGFTEESLLQIAEAEKANVSVGDLFKK